jgi:hypothetical protein
MVGDEDVGMGCWERRRGDCEISRGVKVKGALG